MTLHIELLPILLETVAEARRLNLKAVPRRLSAAVFPRLVGGAAA